MNELVEKLLEQTPIVVLMGVSLYLLWNKQKHDQQHFSDERQQHKNELKELNTYVRERESEHIETLKDLSVLMQSIEDKTIELLSILKQQE